jgi:hypothetical protein
VPGKFGKDGLATFGEFVAGEDEGDGFGRPGTANDGTALGIEGLGGGSMNKQPLDGRA